jgi:hypothetical protein
VKQSGSTWRLSAGVLVDRALRFFHQSICSLSSNKIVAPFEGSKRCALYSDPRMNTSLKIQSLIGLLTLFACPAFALIASIADVWREHVLKSWSEVAATIGGCSVDPYVPLRSASRTPVWYIRCRIAYSTGSDKIETSIRSRTTTSGWGGDAEGMHQWVGKHPSGSTIVIHYNPQNAKDAVLTATDMPYAGPRTPSNLKLLLIASVACVGFFMLARQIRPNPQRGDIRLDPTL